MSNRIRLGAVILATVLCLAWVLAGLDPQEVLGSVRGVRPEFLALAVVLTTLTFFLRVARFQLLLGDARPSFRRQSVVCAISFLAINVVPFRLGELVRSFMLLDDGIEWGRSLGAVAVERVLDLFALLLMLSVIGFAVDLPAAVVVQGIDVLAAGQRVIGVALVGLTLGLFAVFAGGPPVQRLLERIPVLGPKLATLVTTFRQALQHLAERPLYPLGAVFTGVWVWFFTIATLRAMLFAFPGMPTGWDVALAVTAFTVAGMVAIPTPGFFGPFEAFCKATLVLWAVDPASAAALAILWHGISFGFHVVTGGALLLREGLSLGTLVRGSRGSRGADT